MFVLGAYHPSFNPEKNKQNQVLCILLQLLALIGVVSYPLILIILIYDPRAVNFLGDLVPQKYFVFPVRLLIIVFHAYLLVIVHASIVGIGCIIITYGFYVTPILIRELRRGRPNTYRMEDTLRRPENIRHVYRSLQVLHANALCFMGFFIVICNALFMATSIYWIFVLVRYWEKLQLISKAQIVIWSVVFMGAWTFVLELGRFLFSKGNKVLGSWKGGNWGSVRENRLMKKFHRSCKPIVLSYGRQFVVGKVSVLVFLRGVTRGMFRALLTTKK